MMKLMGLISLTYDSSAVELFSEVELVDLLKLSREKNTRLGLTGMLLHKNGEFMQVLEGEQRSVEKLYSAIEQDLRHRNCSIVRWEAIKERRFPAWSMGFRNLQNLDLRQMPGYSPFMDEPLTSPSFLANPSRAHNLLQMFREKE